MMSEKKVPAIRFRGFEDDWEQRKLGDIADSFEYGLNAAAKEFDGQNKYIRITDIDDTTHEFLQTDLTSPDTNMNPADNYRLSRGDILFARTGASVGKTYIYKETDGLAYYAGFLIRARIKEKYDPEFVFQNTLTPAYENYIRITSQRSGQPGVNAQEYAEYDLMVPSLPEQRKIGAVLQDVDNLITLHQRKLEKLKIVKKTMLVNCFPKNGEKVPKFKFSGFTDDWEQRKLGELAEIKDSARIPNAEWSDFGVPYIRASDITNKDASGVLFISNERYEFYKNKTGAPIKGDVLFNGGGEIGKTMLNSSDSPIYVQGGAVLYARTSISDNLEGQYLKTYFETPNAQHYFETASAGGTMKHFTLKPSQEMPIKLPQMKEQKKIGSFFSELDNLITLHQSKCYGRLRHAFLNTTISWEQRKLGDVYSERNERGNVELDILSVSIHHGISQNELDTDELGKSVRRSDDKSLYKHVYYGDLVFNMMRAWQGAIGVVKNEGMVSPAYISAIPDDSVFPEFMDYCLRRKRIINQINNLSYGVTDFRKRLYWEPFTRVTIMMPSVDEQRKITDIFHQLDDLITLHQRELKKLQMIKKSMLRSMFV